MPHAVLMIRFTSTSRVNSAKFISIPEHINKNTWKVLENDLILKTHKL